MINGVMEAYRQVKPEIRGSIPGRSFNIVIVVTRPDAKLGRSRCNSGGWLIIKNRWRGGMVIRGSLENYCLKGHAGSTPVVALKMFKNV